MSELLRWQTTACPYCGASIELTLDGSAGNQCYIEDCSVCCRAIECRLCVSDGECWLEVRRDDE